MKFIILVVAISLSTLGFSQANNSQSVLQQIAKGETNKVVLDFSNYNPQDIANFKEELTAQKTQITLVHYNETAKIFTFIYNGFMNPEKITSIFDKNSINHILNTNTQLYKHN
jgi:hypothetical protein